MGKKKQIEEMAEVLRNSCENECFRREDGFIDCDVCKACQLYEAGCRKQSGWISVAERLPEEGEIVLVITSYGFYKVASWHYYSNKVIWETNDEYGANSLTHWMPLPEPPKGV